MSMEAQGPGQPSTSRKRGLQLSRATKTIVGLPYRPLLLVIFDTHLCTPARDAVRGSTPTSPLFSLSRSARGLPEFPFESRVRTVSAESTEQGLEVLATQPSYLRCKTPSANNRAAIQASTLAESQDRTKTPVRIDVPPAPIIVGTNSD